MSAHKEFVCGHVSKRSSPEGLLHFQCMRSKSLPLGGLRNKMNYVQGVSSKGLLLFLWRNEVGRWGLILMVSIFRDE